MNIIGKLLNYIKYNISKIILPLNKEKKTIWLIGENLGNYTSDNGYYFFEYMISNHKEKVYFVYDNNNLDILKTFPNNVVKRNSIKHFILYAKTKYILVSHGIHDAIPTFIVQKRKHKIKPIIYLQHGIIKFKSIHFNSQSYNKSIIRFITSSDREKEIVTTEMQPPKNQHDLMSKKWNLYSYIHYESVCDHDEIYKYISKYAMKEKLAEEIVNLEKYIGIHESRTVVTGLARHDSLIKESEFQQGKNQILIFPTWRDDLNDSSIEEFELSDFYIKYSSVLKNKSLIALLTKYNCKIKFILHSEMKKFEKSFLKFSSSDIIIDNMPKNIRNTLLESKYLITDYSSLSWEFNLLNRPVIFFQFDYEDYFNSRSNYVINESEWFGERVNTIEELQHSIKELLESETTSVEYATDDIKYRDGHCCERIYKEIKSIPKKVNFLVYNIYGVGGTVKTVTNTANYLYEKGYDIEIISVKQTSSVPKLGLHPGIKIKSLYDNRKNTKRYKSNNIIKYIRNKIIYVAARVPSLLINKDEDLYRMFSLHTDLQLMRVFKSLVDCTLVTTIPSFNYLATKYCADSVRKIGQEHKSFHVHPEAIKKMIEKSYPNLDMLTVLTDDDFRTYKKKKMVDDNNLTVQPNGTCVEGLEDDLSNRPKRIISLARFTRDKRLDLLIRSFHIIYKKYPDWTLDIFGQGKEEEKLIALVEELKLTEVVSINPSTMDIKKELLNSSIFALSSENEGFGMTIIEANSFGVPVVAFNIPNGPRQLILKGKTGLLAKPFDIFDYSEKLSLLIEDKELRIKLGRNSHLFVKEHYSMETVGKQFEEIL